MIQSKWKMVLCVLGTAGLLAACGDDDSNNANNGTNNNGSNNNGSNNGSNNGDGCIEATPPEADCSLTVAPCSTPDATAERIQTALIVDAKDGDTVCFVDGTYNLEEELSLDVANVTLRGETRDGTILDFSNQTSGSNGIAVTSDGFKIMTMTVKNTKGDAIRVTDADGVEFNQVTVIWEGPPSAESGAYGLYPVGCTDVLIDDCKVSGASDAGIYVGQSENILVKDSEAFGNVAGIEIENSKFAEVVNNYTHDNTGGLLIFDLPDLPAGSGHSTKAHNNRIEDNNVPNFAPPGNIVATVPTGTGILLLSADGNEIHDNIIKGNQSVGIVLVSHLSLGMEPENFDVFPESNYFHDNTFENNGYDPQNIADVIMRALGQTSLEAMVWDGWIDTAKDNTDGSLTNCFMDNVDETGAAAGYVMFDYEGNFQNATKDLGDNECTGIELPNIVIP